MEEAPPSESAAHPGNPDHRGLLKKLGSSLVLAVLLGLFLSLPSAGFLVGLVIIPQLILIPLRLSRGIRNPAARRENFGRVAIWLVMIALVLLVHHVREDNHRKYANAVVAKLEAFAAAHGQYPDHIEDIGIKPQELHDRLGYGGYIHENGKPYFFLQSSFLPFSTSSYDFRRHKWSHHHPS